MTRFVWRDGPVLLGNGWGATVAINNDLTPWRADGRPDVQPKWFGIQDYTETVPDLGLMRRWVLALGLIAIMVTWIQMQEV